MKKKIISGIMLIFLTLSILAPAFKVQPVKAEPGTITRYPWSMFRHDVNHTGYTESPAPNTNQTLWSYTTGSYVRSSPAVVGGKVYVGSNDKNVYCLDASTGAYIWSYTTGNWVYSSPAVFDGKVYIGSLDYKVYCLDASTGAHVWNYTTGGGVYSSPAVADGKVYVGSYDYKVYCLDASTGAHVWNYTTGNWVFSSSAVVGGKVYVGSYDYKVYCLDAATGAHVWNYTTGNYGDSSPTVVGGKVYVGSSNYKVYCLDASTGAHVWNYTTGGGVYSSPAVVGGKVYVGSTDKNVYCLDASTGAYIWNYTAGLNVWSSPAVADGKVYVASEDAKVYCLDASTGAYVWSYTTGNWVYSSPAVADRMVFIGSSDYKVYAFGSRTITVPDDYPTIQKAINAANPGDTIYVRAGTCYENVIVNQSVSLIGENRKTTIIDGSGDNFSVFISQNNVNITGFKMRNAYWGIVLYNVSYCNIAENDVLDNDNGIELYSSLTNRISGNNISTSGGYGIYLGYSSNNTISRNILTNNAYGIYTSSTSSNHIYHNNFVDNTFQVGTVESIDTWDNGYPSGGNYWSNYNGTDSNNGPYQNETGSDGIGDTPYSIGEESADNYPLMDPWIISPPDPSHMIVGYQNLLASTLDPARCYDTLSGELILNVYETLIFFDEEKTNQFVPRLATDWGISEDGLTYTFTIRQGVKFHNNETLTTEDVEYSFERILVIEDELAWMFYEPLFDAFGSRDDEGHFNITGQQLNDAVTRNATAVTLHLAKPYPPMMQILSQAWSSILCKKWCIEIGDWPGTWGNWTLYNRPGTTAIENQSTEPPGPHINAMCGTGPFMLDYYQKRFKWSIVKFDGYWGGWPATGSGGFLQRVTSKRIVNWEVLKNMFLEGQLDHINVPRNASGEVLGQPGIRCIYPLEQLICDAIFFTFNISTSSPYLGVPGGLPIGTFNQSGIPPDFFSDINVRKGFAYAFNYSKLIEEELRGEAYQPATPIIPGLPFYNPAQEKYSTNLEIAADYFVAAWNGQVWDNGFNFTICYNEGNLYRQRECEIIKENVESLNDKFHIQIQSLPWENYTYLTRNHEMPIFQYGWLADYADPHNFVYAFMYSGGTFTQWQTYSNATIDTLTREGIGTMNETARRQIYYELQLVYHEDCPNVPTYQPIGRRFERDWVRGWYYNPQLWMTNYFYVQWKGSMPTSTRYSWPMFHHDLKHTGYSESPAPNTNQTRWNYTTGGLVYGPVVADGKVYFGSGDKNVYCLDALTGAHVWNYTTGDWVSSSPAVVDGRVYVGSDDKNVYCLDALTGVLIWNYTTGYWVFSSPAVADGKVYVGSCDTKVYCLDALTGAHIWNYTTGYFVRSCPAVADGKVYVGSDDNKTYCLNALTGAQIWNYTTGYFVGSSPAVVNGRVYVGSYDNNTYCLDALTGALIWNHTTGGYVFSSPAVVNGKAYVGSCDNKVYCLDALTGAHIWNYTTGYFVTSSPAVADGKVYVGSYDTKVYCLDASTGACIWSYKTGIDWVHSSPAVADGMVFVGSDDGIVYAFGNVIRVPEDYKTVQEAISAASPGATIIIAPGVYHESIVVNKTLTIIGLPGSAPIFSGGGTGIAIILLPGASGSVIAGIVITHWDQGIVIVDATNVKIYDNIMSLINNNGITLEGGNAADNLIYSNILQESDVAINLTASAASNTIYKNIVVSNNIGLNLESDGNNITANTIAENEVGIELLNSNNNIIYHNNFIANDVQASILTSTGNTWDNGYPSGGNYWGTQAIVDQYKGASQNQLGSDGINDTQYTIAVNNVDRYPLAQPFSAHDTGITCLITSKSVVGKGFTLRMDLKILNYGVYDETFTLIIYANTSIIATQTITLTRRNSTTIIFNWNTASVNKGNYTISAYVRPVPDEGDTTDNSRSSGVVHVGTPGDFNADRIVDILDAIVLGEAFGTTPGIPRWNPNADINSDGTVDIFDAIILGENFGQSW